MKLIVGLGNIGREYKKTRHNLGFMVIDNYLGKVNWKNKMEADIFIKDSDKEQIVFIKPRTYMNLSGLAVGKVAKYYKIEDKDILVIQDDMDLAVGTCKVKRNSSAGGHNGIKSIISNLNSDAFGRLKIGIGKSTTIPSDKYVLGEFTQNEMHVINENMPFYCSIIDLFINEGIENTIQKYNQK